MDTAAGRGRRALGEDREDRQGGEPGTPVPKVGATDWTEERGARNERTSDGGRRRVSAPRRHEASTEFQEEIAEAARYEKGLVVKALIALALVALVVLARLLYLAWA